jgi:hypothetical protein
LREFAVSFQAGDAPAQLDKRGRHARRPVETMFGLVPAERRMDRFDRLTAVIIQSPPYSVTCAMYS